ncbi:unnamed protein product [Microthlaspi erraticum]|uniref:F-box domain-containing protein n=1 Tax=Microthlaspi erraticum TaxID=1685480 RepID=A0A6D2LC85_9BRAS|nr:unnamed protein product [Microthlaspi erraticum]
MEELLYVLSCIISEELLPTTQEEARNCSEWIGEQVCQDMISVLPEELIIRILSLIPTKYAVKTMVLSKRWRSVWTLVPKLFYKERDFDGCGSLSRFLNKSLELNKAPMLETLCIQLGSRLPVDAVGNWVAKAVDRCVREIELEIQRTAAFTILPMCLYTCKTLVVLNLTGNIGVDVPSSVCLPSLKRLFLVYVVYRNDYSLFRLLSSANAISDLYVKRRPYDHVRKFIVEVPSLQIFRYVNIPSRDRVGKGVGSLVIESPGLKELIINDLSGDSCLIENLPNLNEACINVFGYLDDKLLRSISSVTSLGLFLTKQMFANPSTIPNFSRLITLDLCPFMFSWFRPLMLLLSNSPKLTVLRVFYCPSFLWVNPSSVPDCLLFHLKTFECVQYGGREGEKQLVAYILANSKCLEKAVISVTTNFGGEYKVKKEKELESMFRVSAASQLLFE